MPIGSYACIPLITQQLMQQAPARVLDLGIGFGGNGAMVRQWLDLGVQPWRTFLVGVEVWAAYRNPVWDLYHLVVIDTIEKYLASNGEQFDAVLLTDVIEHFERERARQVLQLAQQRAAAGGVVMVTTPAVFFEQGPAHGNHFEVHRSSWSEQDFHELGFETQRVGHPNWYCGEAIVAKWVRSQDQRTADPLHSSR